MIFKTIIILSNGEVVPCCLDYNGKMIFGNIYKKILKKYGILPISKISGICILEKKGERFQCAVNALLSNLNSKNYLSNSS